VEVVSDENAMIRILLVDDDPQWLELIERSLPDYRVDSARSYSETLDLLRPGIPYDVAIVDLNLISPERDELGGSILEKLRAEYPRTHRIGLTGLPPGAVRALLDRYDLDDLLLKGSMALVDVRKIVKLAVERTFADVPSNVKAGRWQLLDELRTWHEATLERIETGLRSRRKDLSDADRAGMVNERAARAIRVLETEKSKLEREYATLEKTIANVCSSEDIILVTHEFGQLKQRSETAADDDF
jgi:CheY-like chemotaxis protein